MNKFLYQVQATFVITAMLLVTACGAAPAAAPAADSGAAAAGPAEVVDYTKTYPIKADVEGPCSYASIDAKDYSGKTLNILTHAIPVMGEPTKLHADQFSALTGATVNVVHSPFGDLYQKMMVPFQTGQAAYDVMFYGSLWIGDVNQYLAPVPAGYLDMEQMKDVTANYLDVATWGGQVVQFPVDGDRHALKYRADILEDPKLQEEYKAATGKDLGVPQTWKEYGEQAAFFNGKEIGGKEIFGSAEVAKRDDLMFSAFISRVAPYAKHPDVKGGFYFDLETMTPLVNTPGWVEGLKDFVAAKNFFPPGGENFGLGDEIFSFGGGQTVFSYSWDDAFIQAMEEKSEIRNKVKMAPLPGSNQVWNRTTNKWDEFAEPNFAPYITWGWTSAVAKSSANQDMAFDYLCFFANPANHASDLLVGRYGVNPFRTSDFNIDYWKNEAKYEEAVAQSMIDAYSTMEASKNRVFDLRIPGVQQYMTSMATGVAKAIAGQAEPQAALDEVAAEWEKITDSIGRDAQRTAYENVVKLEDNVASR